MLLIKSSNALYKYRTLHQPPKILPIPRGSTLHSNYKLGNNYKQLHPVKPQFPTIITQQKRYFAEQRKKKEEDEDDDPFFDTPELEEKKTVKTRLPKEKIEEIFKEPEYDEDGFCILV